MLFLGSFILSIYQSSSDPVQRILHVDYRAMVKAISGELVRGLWGFENVALGAVGTLAFVVGVPSVHRFGAVEY